MENILIDTSKSSFFEKPPLRREKKVKSILLKNHESLDIALFCNSFDHLGNNLVANLDNELLLQNAKPYSLTCHINQVHLSEIALRQIKNSLFDACKKINCALSIHEINDTNDFIPSIKGEIFSIESNYSSPNFSSNKVLIGVHKSGLNEQTKNFASKILIDKLKKRKNDVLWQSEKKVFTVAEALTQENILFRKLLTAEMVKNYQITFLSPSALKGNIDTANILLPKILKYFWENNLIDHTALKDELNFGLEAILSVSIENANRCIRELNLLGLNAFFLDKAYHSL